MTSPKSYNLHAGILMTVLIGSAFVVHRHAEQRSLAASSFAAQEVEAEAGGGGSRAPGGQLLARETQNGQQTP